MTVFAMKSGWKWARSSIPPTPAARFTGRWSSGGRERQATAGEDGELLRRVLEQQHVSDASGEQGRTQELVLLQKEDGAIHQREVLPVRFVPMTGEASQLSMLLESSSLYMSI